MFIRMFLHTVDGGVQLHRRTELCALSCYSHSCSCVDGVGERLHCDCDDDSTGGGWGETVWPLLAWWRLVPLPHLWGTSELKQKSNLHFNMKTLSRLRCFCAHMLPNVSQVNLVSEHIWCNDFLVRSFYLKNVQTQETRTLTQFHFLSWPAKGIPTSTRPLLDFRRYCFFTSTSTFEHFTKNSIPFLGPTVLSPGFFCVSIPRPLHFCVL